MLYNDILHNIEEAAVAVHQAVSNRQGDTTRSVELSRRPQLLQTRELSVSYGPPSLFMKCDLCPEDAWE